MYKFRFKFSYYNHAPSISLTFLLDSSSRAGFVMCLLPGLFVRVLKLSYRCVHAGILVICRAFLKSCEFL